MISNTSLAQTLERQGGKSLLPQPKRSAQPMSIMKRAALALLFAGVSTLVVAMDFHAGTYSTLKLEQISQKELTVTLKGYVVITGKIEAVWEAGKDGVPMFRRYSLLPDAEAAARLPTLDEYRVTKIHISNGADALRLAAGPEVARAFENRQTLRVTAVGTFRLTQVGMGRRQECALLVQRGDIGLRFKGTAPGIQCRKGRQSRGRHIGRGREMVPGTGCSDSVQ